MDELLNEPCRESSCGDQPCDCERNESLSGNMTTGNCNTAIGVNNSSSNSAINTNTFLGYRAGTGAVGTAINEPSYNTEAVLYDKRKAREINIKPLNYGYLVNIGCQQFAVENSDKLAKMVGLYLKDPNKIEKEWMGENKLPE